jgi:fused signal recognition particle receptor
MVPLAQCEFEPGIEKMLNFLRRKKNTDVTPPEPNSATSNNADQALVETQTAPETVDVSPPATEAPITLPPVASADKPSPPETAPRKPSLFARLKAGLTKTRTNFANGLANLLLGKKTLDTEVLDLIETQLLTADVGVQATQQLVQHLTQKLARKELNDTQTALRELQEQMKNLLRPYAKPLTIPEQASPFVLLVVGINGSGKTTTIGKIANQLKSSGKNVLLAAGDTFRAAAIEQLQIWGNRNQVPVIAQQPGADTAAVIYDAMESAKARKTDVLIADTAGRLHTQIGLMDELKKVKRVLGKLDPAAPHETLLILDASIGQNALNQAIQFNEAIGITGIALTKLDGTAKGGIIFAIAEQLKLPIRYIGVGEGIEDLRPFVADEFVDALFES